MPFMPNIMPQFEYDSLNIVRLQLSIIDQVQIKNKRSNNKLLDAFIEKLLIYNTRKTMQMANIYLQQTIELSTSFT